MMTESVTHHAGSVTDHAANNAPRWLGDLRYARSFAGRKRIEADMIAGPAWTLESRILVAAIGTASASTQLVA